MIEELFASIEAAERRIRPYIRETYVAHSAAFSAELGADLWFKCDNLQHTGSFKVRGAFNKLLTLREQGHTAPVITASTGNHGAAVAYALRQLDMRGAVCVPETADPGKVAAIRRLGASVEVIGHDPVDTEQAARARAAESGVVYVSPYNDPAIVAGQGTLGVEVTRQLPAVDVAYVALGGGGLISGVAAALKAHWPDIQIVGCSPANSAIMIQSVAAGHIVAAPSLPTLSDGTAGGVEPAAITFEYCRRLVDRYVTVSEQEIATALVDFIGDQHMLIEGAAAVSLAAVRREAAQVAGQRVLIVLCGANIGLGTLRSVLATGDSA